MTTSSEWAERLGISEPEEVRVPTVVISRPWDKVRYYMAIGLGFEDISVKLGIPANTIRDFVLRGGKP